MKITKQELVNIIKEEVERVKRGWTGSRGYDKYAGFGKEKDRGGKGQAKLGDIEDVIEAIEEAWHKMNDGRYELFRLLISLEEIVPRWGDADPHDLSSVHYNVLDMVHSGEPDSVRKKVFEIRALLKRMNNILRKLKQEN